MLPVNNYPRFTANEKTWLVNRGSFLSWTFLICQNTRNINHFSKVSNLRECQVQGHQKLTYSTHREEPSGEPFPCPMASGRKLIVFHARFESPLLVPFQPHDAAHVHPPSLHAHPRKQSVSRDRLLSPLSLS